MISKFRYKCLLLLALIHSAAVIVNGDCSQDKDFCPSLCNCRPTAHENVTVAAICSSRSLAEFPPELPRNLLELNLENNMVSSVTSQNLKGCSRLKTLRLSNNQLGEIENEAFTDTASLEELYLDNNQLILTDANKDTFSKLTNLKELRIHNNREYSDEILWNLTSIEGLSIDRKDSVFFGIAFHNLHYLNKLEIYGQFGSLSNESFANLSFCPLKNIKIQSTIPLHTLEPATFAYLSNLEYLDLGYNTGTKFEVVSKSWYGLQFTNINTLILTRIISDDDIAPVVSEEFYQDIDKCTKLRTLLLNKNNIATIKSGLSRAFAGVEHLDLSYNRMTHIGTLMSEVQNMTKLRFVDFSYQVKRPVTKRSIDPHHDMAASSPIGWSVNATRKIIQKRDTSFAFSKCRAEEFDLLNVLNYSIKDGLLRPHNGIWYITMPTSLETLNISASLNIALSELPKIVMLTNGMHRLKNLIYKENGLKKFIGPFFISNTNPNLSLTVDVSDNGMNCLAPNCVKQWIANGAHIGQLLLSNNDLGLQLENDINGTTFKDFRSLTTLNLAANNIKALPPKIFHSLTPLQHLNISGNSLQTINFEFSHLQKLKYLDVSDNMITNLNAKVLDDLEALHLSTNLTVKLNLNDNSIQCSCDTWSFINWMHVNKLMLVDYFRMSCNFRSENTNLDRYEDLILPKLRFDCSIRRILIMSLSIIIGVALLTTVTSTCLYKYRWDIRFWLMKQRNTQVIPDRPYRYDAFISYDHKDIAWVRGELLRHLDAEEYFCLTRGRPEPFHEDFDIAEEDLNSTRNMDNSTAADEILTENRRFQFCLADRDFNVGESIEDNITQIIKQSRKVVFVLSENFLKSKWCNLELELAAAESHYRGANIMIPIKFGRLKNKDMWSCLRWFVRHVTYIEWKEQPADRAEFWNNLSKALLDPSKPFTPSEQTHPVTNQVI